MRTRPGADAPAPPSASCLARLQKQDVERSSREKIEWECALVTPWRGGGGRDAWSSGAPSAARDPAVGPPAGSAETSDGRESWRRPRSTAKPEPCSVHITF